MDLSRVRILVVDDNRQAAELVKSILGGVGANDIRQAVTASEAFDCLRNEMIDLVILDQNLGAGGDGLELVRRIRNDPRSPNPYVAILMLTGHADERRVLAARDVGANEFLAKPFNVTSLLKRIEALIFQTRGFVRSPAYFGPDRRRREDRDYDGAERRSRSDGGSSSRN
ncbi:response regulator [Phenylobacterium sp. LjRoot225]|uniref:response regulator n=1 Tax=Phenylobacterium sp. LjRoot225 TaxID=3342285 RepID=UPI003ECDBC5C